jgi:hypothetical protein
VCTTHFWKYVLVWPDHGLFLIIYQLHSTCAPSHYTNEVDTMEIFVIPLIRIIEVVKW